MISTIPVDQWFSNFSMHQSHLEVSQKHRLLDPASRVPDSVGLRLGLRISIFDQLLGDTDQ